MEQYIIKSALVAEIERRNVICKKVALDLRTQENKDYYQGKAEAYKEVLDILNTLEVKEVGEYVSNDLEEEITRCIVDEDMNFAEVARHFAQWQKQQLMKDAVDGSVCAQRPNGEVIVRTNFIRAGLALMEKVKLIIIKK